ncbi:MAG: ABC transporter permease [Rhodospirillaceae bacterium]|nr:ABC transporter permease [Rhodospirillaceae bacterium]
MIITPNRGWFELNLSEVWQYRDLLWIFVKRDFTTFYKQTILGPLWFFIQPLISTIVFTVVFNRVAGIPTDEIPPFLFYMSGIIAWNYFVGCLTSTSGTFTTNAGIFGKVYFPRIIVPLSTVISGLFRFGVQLIMFLGFYFYYLFQENYQINPSPQALLFLPIMIVQMAMLGQGMGMIISSLTTKYRDLNYLLSFGTQLMMYASPIVYPFSVVPENYKIYILANPMTPIIEGFRQAFIGKGLLEMNMFIYSIFFTLITFIIGLLVFNKIEKDFIDTV